MSLASAILARRMHLPRARTRDVVVERDLRVPMDDGAVLLADRWVARDRCDVPQPTVLLRSPYGRGQVFGLLLGRLLAERGLQVVIQSVRGTFGSTGEFSPFEEREDGLETLAWLREQPWHRGRIGMAGASYLGLVQWAVAPEAGDDLAALTISVSASQFHGQAYAGGSLSLESSGSWLVLVAAQERRLAPLQMARALRRLPALFDDAPISEFDARATGARVDWFQQALANPEREDDWWVRRDFATGVGAVRAPVQLIGGWQDIFLPWMCEDFAALRAAGREAQLIIGPWSHGAPGLAAAGLHEGVAWLRAHLLGDERMLRARAPVRICVTGERPPGGRWRELADWPPPGLGERRLWPAPDGVLREDGPAPQAGASGYRYDPARPTPSLGGPVLLAREPVTDNRPLEARDDVVSFTTAPLESPLEAIGPARVELRARASRPYFDLFARVCDVSPDGVSRNVCDALARVAPGRFAQDADATWTVGFDLWPMAHRFAAGHRVRLLVASGAHPRYARNPGTGEPPGSETALEPVDVELLHGAADPSVLVLPAGGG
ncbi:MAG: CocE/NonD family hydrolase [Solirubrobacteraceae bacterium]|jgi:putative CocE/NonD family hydrolase|nr:CocE/NonD family hydrolase [Solirubrobacteraceae bacterium]